VLFIGLQCNVLVSRPTVKNVNTCSASLMEVFLFYNLKNLFFIVVVLVKSVLQLGAYAEKPSTLDKSKK